MRAAVILILGCVSLGAVGCTPGAYRFANEPATATRVTSARPAHCRDLPADVPCRHADVGK
jgi:hypothetical protein